MTFAFTKPTIAPYSQKTIPKSASKELAILIFAGPTNTDFLDSKNKLIERLRAMPVDASRNRMKANRTFMDLFLHGDLAAAVVLEEPLPPSRAAGTKQHPSVQMYKTGGIWKIINVVIYSDRYQGQADGRILDLVGIGPGMTIGEIGAGDGRYTFPLARRVGDRGKVLANDIDPKALDELRSLCKKAGTKNIETLVGNVDHPMFPNGALDLAIMVLVYHHLEQPVALLKNLKPGRLPGMRASGRRPTSRPVFRVLRSSGYPQHHLVFRQIRRRHRA
jgi:SAM-dependent methyltransferase